MVKYFLPAFVKRCEGLFVRQQAFGHYSPNESRIVFSGTRSQGGDVREASLDDPGLLEDEVWEILGTEPICRIRKIADAGSAG